MLVLCVCAGAGRYFHLAVLKENKFCCTNLLRNIYNIYRLKTDHVCIVPNIVLDQACQKEMIQWGQTKWNKSLGGYVMFTEDRNYFIYEKDYITLVLNIIIIATAYNVYP